VCCNVFVRLALVDSATAAFHLTDLVFPDILKMLPASKLVFYVNGREVSIPLSQKFIGT
jgi:hypothetical protein